MAILGRRDAAIGWLVGQQAFSSVLPEKLPGDSFVRPIALGTLGFRFRLSQGSLEAFQGFAFQRM